MTPSLLVCSGVFNQWCVVTLSAKSWNILLLTLNLHLTYISLPLCMVALYFSANNGI